ncbi:DNA mismatch repair protein [Plasmodium gonderi]|uniref:DNA mismatch repair protein n=1 Tax=Plasmodium gonderi TaxID=77519 RepID=A0A1Y1JLR3_PLAGO|nr:DNA mismatch repair protein [Plasmodium gonderi]GAW83160.1 DNA mismatch repair protein [Plasmodium gonderi]
MRKSTAKWICLFVIVYTIAAKNIMSIKKKLLFNYFGSKKVLVLLNIKKKSVIHLKKSYLSNLVYTKEDDIYRITNLENSYVGAAVKQTGKETVETVETFGQEGQRSAEGRGNNIISNSNLDNEEFSSRFSMNYEQERGENKPNGGDKDKLLNYRERKNTVLEGVEGIEEKLLKSKEKIRKKFEPSDYELRLYKNKWKIPVYWIKKLEKLKNMNAINCIEYLRDDNLLYFDNYKNKGLLKFLNDEKKKYSNCIILLRVGDFYETYGLDSIFLIEFLNIKKMNNKLSCGFIKTSINKALHILTSNNLNICVYEEMNEKSLKMKKRYLSQIVTPEFPIYLNNIQYCHTEEDSSSSNNMNDSSGRLINSFYNSYDLEDYFVAKEIVCIYIESKNIFSLSKINLSLKIISVFDNITFDVLNVYLKNTNFLKVYIHQHHNSSFTNKITQLFKVENYYLFSNFNSSLHFHLFILDKLKQQINVGGLFRLIKNKNVFNVHNKSGVIKIDDKDMVDGKFNTLEESQNENYKGRHEKLRKNSQEEVHDIEERNKMMNSTPPELQIENNEYSYYSYCTPLNIFTSYNMGIYKQNNYYDNRNNYLFYNIIDVNNSDSNSININESMEFFKNIFLFYPPFEVTKHIRYINEYIYKNQQNLIIPNVRPFRNNIIITLLSNLKADHHILKKIFTNVESVQKCMNRFDYSFLTSIFHVLNHQNCFKLNIVKFYQLLINIQNILASNLELSPSNFSYQSQIPAFNEFVFYHENEVHNLINHKLLNEQNKEVEYARKELLERILLDYAEFDNKEGGQKYDHDFLNKLIKVDNTNDIIGIKKKIINSKSVHLFHPLNKKSETMKNIYVTEHVQKKIKAYLSAIDRKKRRINDIIRRVNVQLSSCVHILSFVSNFLQIVQALYNHTINSIKRRWSLPICKHLMVTYEKETFRNMDEKLQWIQKCLYKDEESTGGNNKSDLRIETQVEKDKRECNQSGDNKGHENFVYLSEEEENRISENVDQDSVGEIKKIYKNKNYMNDSLTYIIGAKPYNMNKDNLVKYDIFLKKKKFILLTGKNMSGKTTLSFTLLCILFLANLGMFAPCEEKSIISKFREFYSLKNVNYQEQIENMSLFREQTYYINSIIEEIRENYPFSKKSARDGEIFILFDEPCIATTPVDNAIIISALSDYLKNYCGIIITHNYDLLKKSCLNENIIFKKINENINYLRIPKCEQRAKLENGICKNSEALDTYKHTKVDDKVMELLFFYEKKYKVIHNLSNSLYYNFLDYIKSKRDKNGKKSTNDFFEQFISNNVEKNEAGYGEEAHRRDHSIDAKMLDDILELENLKSKNNYFTFLEGRDDPDDVMVKSSEKLNQIYERTYEESIPNCNDMQNLGNEILEAKKIFEIYEKELNRTIEQIEDVVKKKLFKIGMNEDVPIFFKNKSVVYILCIFAKKREKPYFYIGISDNISERIKCHTRNLLNNKNLLKKEKKNNILNYKFDMNAFYTLLFPVENKLLASKYERELSDFMKTSYDILSK